jgi:hypothetical protein
MTDTEQDRWGELERLAELRLAGCRAAAKTAARFNGDYDKELAGQISFATVGSVPLAPLLELIAEARGRSVGIANGDEPNNPTDADLFERLDAILVEESPMHPFGCATWEEATRVAIDMAKDEITRLRAITRAEASTPDTKGKG